jgi:hypothetical protein
MKGQFLSSKKLSQYFIPTKKHLSKDITVASHQLMLKAGLIKQISSGLYAWLWSWLFICTSTLAVQAQEIDMSGTIDFNRNGDSVTLSAETISNYRSQESTSGDLVLQLWATKVPYYGQAPLSESPWNGIKLAQAPLGTLAGNASRSNVQESVAFTEPPAGYYNVVLVLGELNGSDYRILDWFNFTQIDAKMRINMYNAKPLNVMQ